MKYEVKFTNQFKKDLKLAKKQNEVENAAKQSGCHSFIMSLENVYDTPVGSSGSHLSGGECQRISIARAMLKCAPIVILDEATAYTDPENENELMQAHSVADCTKGSAPVNIGIYGAIYFVILFAAAILGRIPIFLALLSVVESHPPCHDDERNTSWRSQSRTGS